MSRGKLLGRPELTTETHPLEDFPPPPHLTLGPDVGSGLEEGRDGVRDWGPLLSQVLLTNWGMNRERSLVADRSGKEVHPRPEKERPL